MARILKKTYPNAEAVPAADKDLYREGSDGSFVLDVTIEGAGDDVTRLTGSLEAERTAHAATKKKFKGIPEDFDVSTLPDLISEVATLRVAASNPSAEQIKKAVNDQLAARTGPLDRKITELTKANETLANDNTNLKGERTRNILGTAVRKAADVSGVAKTALGDIEVIAGSVFEIRDDDGKVVTRSGIPGVTPGIDADQWISDQKAVRPHWWPPSEGAGARGGDGANGSSGPNPFAPGPTFNVTAQGALVRSNPELAKRMKAAAAAKVASGK